MVVRDYIFRKPITIDQEEPVSTAIKIIFNVGVSIVPIVKHKHRNKKIVGILTQYDVLEKLLPSVKEYIKELETSHESYEAIERRLPAFLTQPVKNVMQSPPITVSLDTPLLRAQSIMLRHKFNRLPVVDAQGHVVGIVSQSDVFHALAGHEIPYDTHEDFHQWTSYYYDQIISMVEKVRMDIPGLENIFEKRNVFRVLDIFSADGSRAVALARKGYNVTGLNRYEYFHRKALEEKANFPKHSHNKPEFILTQYNEFLKDKKEDFDAALLMDNELAHHPTTYKRLLANTSKSLARKNAVIMLQLANFEKIFTVDKQFQNFTVSSSKLSDNVRYGFLEFYDPPVHKGAHVTLNVSIYKYGQNRWHNVGMNSTPIAHITEKSIIKLLKTNGFRDIKTYGSRFLEPIFKQKFIPLKHDWLNVVATR